MKTTLVRCRECEYETIRLDHDLIGNRCTKCDGLVDIIKEGEWKLKNE